MTDTKKPIKIDNHTGTVAVHSVAIKFLTQFEINHLFTNKENGTPKTYPVEIGRVYILGDLLSILGKLTSGFFGTTTNSIVLRTTPSDPISDIKFPAPIETMIGLDKVQTSAQGQHRLQMGTPIKKDDIIFTTIIKSKFNGLGSGVIHKTQKIFKSKAKKHDKIKTLAESKLNSISGLVSKAIEDANVSHEEYQFILKEIEHYRKMKGEIRTKSKKVADTITSEQREEILKQGREEGKQAF